MTMSAAQTLSLIRPRGTDARTHPRSDEDVQLQGRRTLIVAASATLVVLAIFSAVPPTVSDTVRALHGGVSSQTWVLSGMSLGLAATLLTVGALADDLGRRRVLVTSASALVLGAALAAVAGSLALVVVARVLQGAAGAGVVAASLGMIGHAFAAGRPRAHATSVWGAALGAGIALGPLAGAAMSAAAGWRSSYWLQAGAAAALVPAAARLPESRASVRRRVDLPGAALMSGAMAALTAGLIEGRRSFGSVPTVALLAAGALLLAAFVIVELRRPDPMLELRLFRQPAFIASMSGALFTGLAIIGLMSFSPTMMQSGLHVGVLASAAVLAAWSGTSTVLALAGRTLIPRLGAPLLLAVGLMLAAAGETALTGLGSGSGWQRLLPGLIVAGVGSGLANSSLGRLAIDSVPRDRGGMGSGANNTARYLGGAAGVALVVALVSAGSGHGANAIVQGWDTATLVCAVLCAVGAGIALLCRRAQPVSRPRAA
jgi:MFS family permease